jgi:hypothetical protein
VNADGLAEARPQERTFLRAVYDACDGSTKKGVWIQEIDRALGVDAKFSGTVANELVDQGLLRWADMGGLLRLTDGGVRMVRDGIAVDVADFRRLVDEIRTALAAAPFVPADHAEVESDLATISAQLGSPRPKIPILRESLLSLHRAADAATKSTAAAPRASPSRLTNVVEHIRRALSALG